jgi:hypothetical protein
MKSANPKNNLVMRGLFAVALALLLQPAAGHAQSGVMQQGVKVHGDWVIEVRNPDGTLHERRAFKNALMNPGKQGLAMILTRTLSPWLWAISVSQPCSSGDLTVDCILSETSSPGATAANEFKTLSITTPASADKLILSGTFTANRTGGGQISRLQTYLRGCQGNLAPGTSCLQSSSLFNLTTANLQAPVDVAQNQIVTVTVTLSFS